MNIWRIKIFLFLLLFILPVKLFSQATQFVVESFQLDLNDLEANRNPVLDANDKKCALIKVRTDLTGLSFSSNNGIVEQKKVITEYWVYVSYDEKKINVFKEGFIPLNYELPLSLEESKVYTFYITSSKRYSIVIQTDPRDAKIIVDNKESSGPNLGNVVPGVHTVKIERDGYQPIEDTITVDEGRIFFSYKMEKMEPVLATFTSDPSGSAIIINNEYKGQTPKQLFLYPGKYQLQINNEFYQGIKQDITIKNNNANNYNFKLRANISYVGVYTYPIDAEKYIDGTKIFERTKIEGGSHLFEAKKELFYDFKKVVNIPSGADTILVFTLSPIVGRLQFTVNPMDANVELYQDKVMLKNWTGAKRFDDLRIGNYTLVVDAKKYRQVEKPIQIKENETEDVFIDLAAEKGSGRKGKLASFSLSAVMPGLGQYYSGHTGRGIVYTLTGLGTGAAALYYNNQFNKAVSNYNDYYKAYDQAELINDIRDAWGKMEGERTKYEDYYNYRTYLMYSCVAIYGINLLDALISGKKKDQIIIGKQFKNREYFSVNPALFYTGLGLQFKYTF